MTELVKTFQLVIFDYEMIDVYNTAWQRANNEKWNNFEKWDVSRTAETTRSDEYKKILKNMQSWVAKAGPSMFTDS
jgi:hypothetical protein